MSRAAEIRSLLPEDWPAIRAIFEEGMATGDATLETEAPDWPAWDASHDTAVAGWAALAPVSRRPVYRGVAELSIYIAGAHRRQGIGTALLAALIPASEAHGIWTLQATVLVENRASIALHQCAGFRIVGTRERLGARAGVWRDSVLLERRSRVVG
jgi:L-amino acid N-acyltransferase YncA